MKTRRVGIFYFARTQDPWRGDRQGLAPSAFVRVEVVEVPILGTHDHAHDDALCDALDAATPRADESVMNTHFLDEEA